jgi:hypothetical protein
MNRTLTSLFTLVLSSPLAAHEGLALDGAVHNFLHHVGTGNVIAVGGVVLFGVAAWLIRRRLRARAMARHADAG